MSTSVLTSAIEHFGPGFDAGPSIIIAASLIFHMLASVLPTSMVPDSSGRIPVDPALVIKTATSTVVSASPTSTIPASVVSTSWTLAVLSFVTTMGIMIGAGAVYNKVTHYIHDHSPQDGGPFPFPDSDDNGDPGDDDGDDDGYEIRDDDFDSDDDDDKGYEICDEDWDSDDGGDGDDGGPPDDEPEPSTDSVDADDDDRSPLTPTIICGINLFLILARCLSDRAIKRFVEWYRTPVHPVLPVLLPIVEDILDSEYVHHNEISGPAVSFVQCLGLAAALFSGSIYSAIEARWQRGRPAVHDSTRAEKKAAAKSKAKRDKRLRRRRAKDTCERCASLAAGAEAPLEPTVQDRITTLNLARTEPDSTLDLACRSLLPIMDGDELCLLLGEPIPGRDTSDSGPGARSSLGTTYTTSLPTMNDDEMPPLLEVSDSEGGVADEEDNSDEDEDDFALRLAIRLGKQRCEDPVADLVQRSDGGWSKLMDELRSGDEDDDLNLSDRSVEDAMEFEREYSMRTELLKSKTHVLVGEDGQNHFEWDWEGDQSMQYYETTFHEREDGRWSDSEGDEDTSDFDMFD